MAHLGQSACARARGIALPRRFQAVPAPECADSGPTRKSGRVCALKRAITLRLRYRAPVPIRAPSRSNSNL
eukprot:6976127-Pyramimonas_sp.AAC.1